MSAPFSPGDTLAGRYRLTALVQSSPTAEIFQADDLSLTRPVAIHALPHSLANDTEFLAAFRDEATKVASLARVSATSDFSGEHPGESAHWAARSRASDSARARDSPPG